MAIPFFRKDRSKPEAEPAPKQSVPTEGTHDFTTIGAPLGNGHGIMVEEVGGATDSAIDEAAMLYASNQLENAESVLRGLLEGNDQRVWHMLFDLYRLSQREANFEKLALDYAMRFECSPPVWKARENNDNKKDKGVSRPLVLPADLGAGIGDKLGLVTASLQKGSTLQLDFSNVQTIHGKGAQDVADMLSKTRKNKLKFQVSGASAIIDLLKTKMQSEPGEQGYWQMLLAVYQLLGRHDDFENLAIDFAVTFELSPPSWENVEAAVEVAAPAPEIPTDAFVLSGVISEASQEQLAKLMQYAESHDEVVVDCSGIIRVEYGYVGSFIGQIMQLLGTGKVITLQGQNALVHEFLRMMGIDQLAKLVPAKLV